MTPFEELIEGMRILFRLYPNANTGAEHDLFYVYADNMSEDGMPTLDEGVRDGLNELGFHWDNENLHWYYFT